MACGDNSNDAEMLEWAGTGVAVANSVESLRPLASYICKEERSLGVAEAIVKILYDIKSLLKYKHPACKPGAFFVKQNLETVKPQGFALFKRRGNM